MSKLLWLDLETTGLDPDADMVLEVALVITDDNLTHLGVEYQAVVKQDMDAVMARMDDYVRDMHTRNGLLAEVPKGEDPLQVAADINAICNRNRLYKYQDRFPALLAGASVHFDRSFIKRFAPDVHRQLHHRHFDVSTLRHAFGMARRRMPWPNNDNHRAMGDVRDSIDQARVAMGVIRGR